MNLNVSVTGKSEIKPSKIQLVAWILIRKTLLIFTKYELYPNLLLHVM